MVKLVVVPFLTSPPPPPLEKKYRDQDRQDTDHGDHRHHYDHHELNEFIRSAFADYHLVPAEWGSHESSTRVNTLEPKYSPCYHVRKSYTRYKYYGLTHESYKWVHRKKTKETVNKKLGLLVQLMQNYNIVLNMIPIPYYNGIHTHRWLIIVWRLFLW